VNTLLNRIVRGYLRACPITEGKRRLLEMAQDRITPAERHVVAPTRHGFSMRLHLGNPEHRRIYFYGEHDERYETALLRRIVRPGDVCWDIGANIGFFTCLLARLVGPRGRVVAFEPATATRRLLEENVALNGLSNVTVRPEALGDSDARATIHFGDGELAEGTASLVRTGAHAASESVTVARLDTLRPGLPEPDFVKIDVEGMQQAVWRGGAGFFRDASPLVLAELRDSPDEAQLEALSAEVAGLGYRIHEVRKRGIRAVGSIRESGSRNFILGKPSSERFARLRPRVLG
jgi:FkbM family methyltransferase